MSGRQIITYARVILITGNAYFIRLKKVMLDKISAIFRNVLCDSKIASKFRSNAGYFERIIDYLNNQTMFISNTDSE